MTVLQMPLRTPPPPRTLVQDERFYFLGYGVHQSWCRVRVFASGRDIVVVLTNGEGTSVTNTIEQIASELLPSLVTRPDLRDIITWIEHYEAEGSTRLDETFDRVTFGHFHEAGELTGVGRAKVPFGFYRYPHWQRITKQELETLVGSDWPEVFPAGVRR